jgi:hypothetical protein
MADTSLSRKQRLYLVRHFFGRFFDSEVLSLIQTEMHILFIQILALLALPGLLKTFLSITKYVMLAHGTIAERDQAALIDAHFFICLSMILTGFVTVFEWDALFPDKKDFYNLAPLPINPKTIFFAKLAALSLFILLFNIATNGVPAWFFPGEVLTTSRIPGQAGYHIPFGAVFKYQLAHGASLFLSSLFVFTSFLAIRALILFIFPVKLVRTVSRSAQLFLLLILLCSLFSFPVHLILQNNFMIRLMPPFWFLGLYETLIGHHSLMLNSLAQTAYTAVFVSVMASLIGYTLSYQCSMQKGFQSEGSATYAFSAVKRLLSRLLQKTILTRSIERASFHFIAQTVFRRQEQMLYWGSFIAVGIALISWDLNNIRNSRFTEISQHLPVLLSFPLIMSFFILVGLRFAFSIPADLHANWVFQTVQKQALKKAYGGVYKFTVLSIMLPLIALMTPLYLMILNPGLVFLHIIYVALLSLLLMEILLFQFIKIPFTCSYLPGKANLKLWWPAYVIACYIFSYSTTTLEQWMFRDMRRYVLFLAIALIAFLRLNHFRRRHLETMREIRFEEQPPDAITLLTIEQ